MITQNLSYALRVLRKNLGFAVYDRAA